MAQRKCICRHPLKNVDQRGKKGADKETIRVGQANLPGAVMRVRLGEDLLLVSSGGGKISVSPLFGLKVSAMS